MAQRDILIRIGGSVLDTQFTQLVSIMKIECAEAAICAHDFVRLQSATPKSINLKLFGEPIIIGFENLKSEIATRV